MRRQAGFLSLGITGYIALGAAVIIAGISAYAYIQTARLEAVKQEYAAFQAQVKANGEAAEKAAREKEAEDKAKTEKINRENKRLHADNAALNRKLRDKHPAGSGLPETPTNTKRPDLTCLARDELRGAYGKLVTELRAIADQCAADAVDLQSARQWAADR